MVSKNGKVAIAVGAAAGAVGLLALALKVRASPTGLLQLTGGPFPGLTPPGASGYVQGFYPVPPPPAGFYWVIQGATVKVVTGALASKAFSNAVFFQRPSPDNTSAKAIEKTGGDGPYLTRVDTADRPATVSNSNTYAPGNPSAWLAPILATQHCFPIFATFAYTVDEASWELSVQQLPYPAGAFDLVTDNLANPALGWLAADAAEDTRTVVLGTVPAGMEWIAVGAETNVEAGATTGSRESTLQAGSQILAKTGPLDTPSVGNNNGTGSYTGTGTGTQDHAGYHTAWTSLVVIPAGTNVEAVWSGRVGDKMLAVATFIQAPAGTFPIPQVA